MPPIIEPPPSIWENMPSISFWLYPPTPFMPIALMPPMSWESMPPISFLL